MLAALLYAKLCSITFRLMAVELLSFSENLGFSFFFIKKEEDMTKNNI